MGVNVYVKCPVSSHILIPPCKWISLFQFNISPPQFATLVPQTPITWVTRTPSDGSYTKQWVDCLSSWNIPHKVIWAGGEKKRDFYVHKMTDHTNIYIYISPYLANSRMNCAYHLAMTEMQLHVKVKWKFNFDHTPFLIYIWITLWLHQRTFWQKKKRKWGWGGETRSE